MENNEQEKYITLGDIWNVIKKNWLILAIITVVITILGGIYTFVFTTEVYKGTSTLIVEVRTDSNSETASVNYQYSTMYVNTVASLITDDVTVKYAVDKYNTDNVNDTNYQKITYSGFSSEISTSIATSNNYLSYTIKDSNKNRIVALSKYVMEYIESKKNDYDSNTHDDLACDIKQLTLPEFSDIKYSSPNKPLYLIISLLAGLVVGAAVVLIKEFASNKFKTKEEIEALGLPILGVKADNKNKNQENSDDDLVKPSIRAFEPYNRVLTNVKFANVDNPYKVIMVTSTQMEELKTTVCTNLAYAASNNSKKSVVVDLDIRKPRCHKVFKVEKENGVSDYLDGSKTLEEIIKTTSVGVDVITCGKSVDNPIVLLESQKLRDLIAILKEKYDYVFLDTPPLLACSDAEEISKIADGVIYNVAINQAAKKDIRDSISSLQNHGANIIGINITKVKMSKKEGYYYYQYGYGDDSKVSIR